MAHLACSRWPFVRTDSRISSSSNPYPINKTVRRRKRNSNVRAKSRPGSLSETQARTLCGFFFTTVGVLRTGFLEGFASGFLDSI